MKNNKAFTLIELLAIIVILAIIAVIIVPIILNTIENSRVGDAIDLTYEYKEVISEYYVSQMSDNQNLAINGSYSVDNGTLKKCTETIQISIAGDSPSVGWIKIKENEVTKGCLTIGDYKVELIDGKFMVSGKGECDSEMPPVKFDEATPWEDIIDAIQSGESVEGFEVGKEKKVTLTSKGDLGGTYTLRIANLPSDEEKEEGCGTERFSETACGVVLEFVDVIMEYMMNFSDFGILYGTNIGGWGASETRKYLNDAIYNSLPSEMKNAIIDTKVISGHGSMSGESNFTTMDKLYLLATHEVWEDDDNDSKSGIDFYDTAYSLTRQLDYYKKLGVTASNYSGAKKTKYIYGENEEVHWWLRSTFSSNDVSFFSVRSSGDWNDDVSDVHYGVSPAFRIG